ncbi:MAG: N-acetylmuramoyl-L-alanine amidase [Lachnospiraceae bacterium]|nr:N-acetylmuramoyl-L-alanine amidase [Lachnospiraceae bacterium]
MSFDINKWKEKAKKAVHETVKIVKKIETKHWLSMLSTVCVLLLFAVIVLSVRLHGVSDELESVQVMAAGLQEELQQAQNASDKQGAPGEGEGPGKAPSPMPTKEPTATEIPTPAPTPTPKPYTICVDAGHGGWDGGAVVRENGLEIRAEKNDNLRMSNLFKEALEAYGIKVIMTREDDTFLELTERTDIANAADADALISLHRNSFNGEVEVNGVEIWIHSSVPEASRKLASGLLDAIISVGGMQSRGVKQGSMSSPSEDYAINRNAKMTSMIVEFGFITSSIDNDAYDEYGKAYVEKMAEAVWEWLKTQR